MIAACLFSFIVELFNSAIEAVVDRISAEHHILSKNGQGYGKCGADDCADNGCGGVGGDFVGLRVERATRHINVL